MAGGRAPRGGRGRARPKRKDTEKRYGQEAIIIIAGAHLAVAVVAPGRQDPLEHLVDVLLGHEPQVVRHLERGGGCVGAWVRGCVGAWVRGCVYVCVGAWSATWSARGGGGGCVGARQKAGRGWGGGIASELPPVHLK